MGALAEAQLGALVGWRAGFCICFVFNLLRKGEEGGKVNPPHNTFFFFLSNQPTLSRAPGFEGLMSQYQAVFKVSGGLKKLRGSPQVWQ